MTVNWKYAARIASLIFLCIAFSLVGLDGWVRARPDLPLRERYDIILLVGLGAVGVIALFIVAYRGQRREKERQRSRDER